VIAALGVAAVVFLGGRRRWGMIGVIATIALLVNGLLMSPYGNSYRKVSSVRSARKGAQRIGRVGAPINGWLRSTSSRRMLKTCCWGTAQVGESMSTSATRSGFPASHTTLAHARPGTRSSCRLLLSLALWVSFHYCFLLLLTIGRVFTWTRKSKVLFPLMCILGYIVVIFTVSGSDTVSASLLAIGLYHARRMPRVKSKAMPRWTVVSPRTGPVARADRRKSA